MPRRLGYFILGALILGIAVRALVHTALANTTTVSVAGYLAVVTDAFLRLIKMIIAPLVFATLVSAIARMENSEALGRISLKTLVWFFGASFVSLLIGLLLVQLLRPGAHLELHTALGGTSIRASTLTLTDFVTHLVPTSFIDAMARNEILQIVVFSVLVGMAMVTLGESAAAVLAVMSRSQRSCLRLRSTSLRLRRLPSSHRSPPPLQLRASVY